MGQVQLRPLHRRDLPGPIYAIVDGYYVEYRPSRRWDTGFASTVLVHYIANDTSIDIAELRAGSPAFTWGDPLSPFVAHGSIQVDAIDDALGKHRPGRRRTHPAGRCRSMVPALPPLLRPSSPVAADSVIIVGRHLVRIPPRSPAFRLIETAAQLAALDDIRVGARLKTERAELYARIISELEEAHEHISGESSPFDHLEMEEVRRFHRGERQS